MKLGRPATLAGVAIVAGVLFYLAGNFGQSQPVQVSPGVEQSESPYQVDTRETSTCVIKGNISYNTGEKIYHVPGCPNYYDTVINESYGEQWFCTEAEARAAGWRKARNCP